MLANRINDRIAQLTVPLSESSGRLQQAEHEAQIKRLRASLRSSDSCNWGSQVKECQSGLVRTQMYVCYSRTNVLWRKGCGGPTIVNEVAYCITFISEWRSTENTNRPSTQLFKSILVDRLICGGFQGSVCQSNVQFITRAYVFYASHNLPAFVLRDGVAPRQDHEWA